MNRAITRRVLIGCLLATSLLPFASCMAPGQQRRDALVLAAREFNDDVRWGRYDIAATTLPPAESQAFLERASLVEGDLIVADQEVTSVKFGTPAVTATTLARFQWYTQRDPVLRDTIIEQQWALRGGKWILTAQRRTRGDRFPLVTEPAKSVEPSTAPASGRQGALGP